MPPQMSFTNPRDGVHDLRNILGVVASATRLLEETQEAERRRELLASLETAVRRGGEICNALLRAHAEPETEAKRCDLDSAIGDLMPFLRAVTGGDLALSLDLAAGQGEVPMSLDDLETVLVELITNTRKHAVGAHGVRIRTRRAGDTDWLMIADDGQAQIARQRPSYSGHGLLRLERLAQGAGGSLKVRKLPGGGLAVALNLPVRPDGLRQASACPSPIPKEMYHEDRQPVAA